MTDGEVLVSFEVPDDNGYKDAPQLMLRVHEHIATYGGKFKLNQGIPQQEADGTWEVKARDERSAGIVSGVLKTHYGFKILRMMSV